MTAYISLPAGIMCMFWASQSSKTFILAQFSQGWHGSADVQELDLPKLKANMMVQTGTLTNKLGCSTRRQIFYKNFWKLSSEGKCFFSLPSSDSYPCSCWGLWPHLAKQGEVKLLDEAKQFGIHCRSPTGSWCNLTRFISIYKLRAHIQAHELF